MPPQVQQGNDTGLKILHTDINPKLDIVAVHGIGARHASTWSATRKGKIGKPGQQNEPDESVNWLSHKTMLRSRISGIRVMSFSYASDWSGDAVMHTSLLSIGRTLLRCLLRERSGDPDRPLLFITHCFGGLVTMTALTDETDSKLTLLSATVGIIFLGTPFQGTHEMFYQKLPEIAEIEYRGTVHDHILQYLKPGNDAIKQLKRNFFDRRDRLRGEALKLICVAEEEPTQIQKLVGRTEIMKCIVVSAESAHLDEHRGIQLESFQLNHFRLNKFSDPGDSNYNDIVEWITQIKNAAIMNPILPPFPKLIRAPPLPSNGPKEQFKPGDWQEDPLPEFETPILTEISMKIKHQQAEHRLFSSSSKFRPVAGAFSLDCMYMYFRDNISIRVFATEDVKHTSRNKKHHPEFYTICREGQGNIQFASLGQTVGAYVTEKRCFIFKLGQKLSDQQELRLEEQWASSTLKCVSVSEIILEDSSRLILVAIGLEGNNLGRGNNVGSIVLFRVWTTNWKSKENTHIWQSKELFTLEETGQKEPQKLTDSPKNINFSSNGSILVCTTKRYNQIHAWKLPARETITKSFFGHIKKLCSAMIPFNEGPNVKGISAAVPWTSSRDHPYVVCTTVPSTQRNNNKGGEWTFMSPLSEPLLVAAKGYAYHCFIQIQGDKSKHCHIHGAAISPLGNVIAILDSNGRMCLMPIASADKHGGFRSVPGQPIEIKTALGQNDELRSDIRFDATGRKLYAITHSAAVEITLYAEPVAEPSQAASNRQSRLPSVAESEFSKKFD